MNNVTIYNTFTIIKNKPTRSWQTNLLHLLAPNGSRLPAHKPQVTMVCPDLGFPYRAGRRRPGRYPLRPRIIEVVNKRKAFCAEDGIFYSAGVGGFMNPGLFAFSQRERGFHSPQVWLYRPERQPFSYFCRPLVAVIDIWNDS